MGLKECDYCGRRAVVRLLRWRPLRCMKHVDIDRPDIPAGRYLAYDAPAYPLTAARQYHDG